MKIQRLEIWGFKSFPDKTVVEFKKGITGIVGPNGCGKSNIVDAIRWVMGEMSAKHLRGKAMEDVIFSGTEKRSPTNVSEVTLVFSAEDGRVPAAYANYSEIAIRRRLYRSGESEYFINNTLCRLKDIHDLFLGTGVGVRAYSIIEQGKIGQILTSKPEERRLILEEAAGISKFKSRKESALRKIEATRANLLRLNDLLAELKRQMNSLDRQARKAEKYREIADELREIELHLGSVDFLDFCQRLEADEAKLKIQERADTELSTTVGEGENAIEGARLELSELERALMHLQENLYEKNHSVQLHQAAIDFKTGEIDSLSQQNVATLQKITLVQERLAALADEIVESDLLQSTLADQAQAAEGNYREIQARLDQELEEERRADGELESQNQKIYQLLREISDKNARLDSLNRRKVDVAGRVARDQAETLELQNLLQEQRQRLDVLQDSVGVGQQLKIGLQQQRDSVEATLKMQREERVRLESEWGEIKDLWTQKSSRLKSLLELENNFEGYKEGVRNVMMRNQDEVLGLVADILETEKDYEHAVGAALGEKLQYVVVQDQRSGVEALEYLKNESSGRLSCIPMQIRAEFEEAGQAVSAGVIGPLKNFVRIKSDYEQIGNFLFSNTYLVKTLTDALQIWNENGPSRTFVTLDGELVDPHGVVSGGSKREGGQAILEKKREIKRLHEEVNQLETRSIHHEREVQRCRERIQDLEASLETLKRDCHGEELKLVHQEQDLNHLKNEMRRSQERFDKLQREVSGAAEDEQGMQHEIADLQIQVHELEARRDRIQAATQEMKSALASRKQAMEVERTRLLEARGHWTEMQQKREAQTRESQRLKRGQEEAEQNRVEFQASLSAANEKTLLLKQEIETSRQSVAGAVQEIQEKEVQATALKDQVTELQNRIQQSELALRQGRKDLEQVRSELNQNIVRVSELRTKLQVLREQILSRYHLELGEIAANYADKPLDREVQEPQARELRGRLEKLGNVNLDAIEEFKELSERHDFLNRQSQDLETSLDSLQRALQKVNRTTKQRLQDAFEKINHLFQEVFPKLFKGGHAELRLTDPDNVLESGVDIVAQPPGKKLQNVLLLSGGEKALTAISLIFAIFLLKPSPFCLLDEVDAPLDDVNIDRFNEMVRSMVDRSQFIIITHNKRTMEMADVLYGITMEQAGVSKLVSVQLE